MAMSQTLARRAFLAGAAAAIPAAAIAATPSQTPANDARILDLAGQINSLYAEVAAVHPRVKELIELRTRYFEQNDHIPFAKRSSVFYTTPDGQELERLCDIQSAATNASDPLINELFDTPAQTREGKIAKLSVLKDHIWDDDWRASDSDADWHILLTRKLLWDLVGAHGLTI